MMDIRDCDGGLSIVWLNSAIKFECSHGSVSPVARFIQVVESGTSQVIYTSLRILPDTSDIILNVSECKKSSDAAKAKIIWCLLTTLISLPALGAVRDRKASY